jgi:hypothetical protein
MAAGGLIDNTINPSDDASGPAYGFAIWPGPYSADR